MNYVNFSGRTYLCIGLKSKQISHNFHHSFPFPIYICQFLFKAERNESMPLSFTAHACMTQTEKLNCTVQVYYSPHDHMVPTRTLIDGKLLFRFSSSVDLRSAACVKSKGRNQAAHQTPCTLPTNPFFQFSGQCFDSFA